MKKIVLLSFVSVLLLVMAIVCSSDVLAWSNGGYSGDPSNPDYGTHDWIAEHALDWLPEREKRYILDNLAAYLYGTELPDNGIAPDGIGDTAKHHVYYWSNGSIQDDVSAVRADEEYNDALNFLKLGDLANASKTAGIMSHYIVDVAVFGHVMGAGTDWGAEEHHINYETYVNQRTSGYDTEFNVYLSFDGELDLVSAYDATKELAYDTTFDVGGDLTCVWMDQNYNWSDSVFKNRCGESLNLGVNYLTDVLHTLYSEAASVHNIDTGLHYLTIQEAIDVPETLNGHTILVDARTYHECVVINKSVSLVGENRSTTILDGKGLPHQTIVSVTEDDVTVSSFTIQNGGIDSYGIRVLNHATNCTIESSSILNTSYGIYVDYSNSSNLIGNDISNCYYGIILIGSGSSIINNNRLTKNAGYGIVFSDSGGNIVNNNSIIDNEVYGIQFWSSGGNILRNNTLINNKANFEILGKKLSDFIIDIATSNKADGKPIYYLINQHNVTIEPSTFPNLGILGS